MKKKYVIIAGLVIAGISHVMPVLAKNGVNIQQVPSGAKSIDGKEEKIMIEPADEDSHDYQTEILNNPEINERARSKAVIEENKFNGDSIRNPKGNSKGNRDGHSKGNKATIIQSGKSNKSSIKQEGNGNYAIQKQKGGYNDLSLEQNGNNNHSVEEQTGYYNHKVIIQNGEKYEETITDKNSSPQDE